MKKKKNRVTRMAADQAPASVRGGIATGVSEVLTHGQGLFTQSHILVCRTPNTLLADEQ